MVGTCVRYSRERLDSLTGAITLQGACCIAFIAIQIMHVALLAQSQRMELDLLACVLATSLLAYAFFGQTATRASPERQSFQALSYSSCQSDLSRLVLTVPEPVSDQAEFAIPLSPLQAAPFASASCRHETWTDLMGRISHEIRTPLNAVIGFSELMSREMYGPLGHRHYGDYVLHIKDSSHAVLKSAEDTLALSSLLAASNSSLAPQTSSLAELLEDAWMFLEAQAARRGISLERSHDGAIEIVGDRLCYRQVILNVLSEALERCPDHQTIVFNAVAFSERVRVSVSVAGAKPMPGSTLPSLPLSVARALLERQGATLVTSTGQQGQWQATTVLDTAVQSDFFGRGERVG
jgi:signal transduction histidine kinase